MKKILSLILSILMIFSLCALAACGSEPAAEENKTEENKPADSTALKFGTAVYVATPVATSATEEEAGAGELNVTIAAVSVDANGKIVDCALDTMQSTASYTTEGKAEAATAEFKTKYELGFDYNMVKYGAGKAIDGGDVTKEWFEQIDAFKALVLGKTADEVKALVVNNYRGTEEVIGAGCTIGIAELAAAVDKAYNAAVASDVTANDTLKVTAYTELESTDASEENGGSQKLSVYTCAAAVNAEGKVVKSVSDCVEVEFTFDTKGATTFNSAVEVLSKRELGSDYKMVEYGKGKALNGGDVTKEWFEQADAFDSQCVGKTGAEIKALIAETGRGVEGVQTAGCTIYVSGLVGAASKL